jgi:hypothetical protein
MTTTTSSAVHAIVDFARMAGHRIMNLPIYLLAPLLLGGLLAAFIVAFSTYLVILSFSRVIAVRVLHTDIYSALPRPKDTSWRYPIYGHLGTIRDAKPAEAHLAWIKELNSEVYVYRGSTYAPRLMMADPRAMNYILSQTQCYNYPKPHQTRRFLAELLGEGLLVAEGECSFVLDSKGDES